MLSDSEASLRLSQRPFGFASGRHVEVKKKLLETESGFG